MSSNWTITDARGNSYTIDGVSIENGWPDFTVGRETELILFFDEGNHTDEYTSVREFGEYLFSGAIQTGTDYREQPFFKEYIHPQTSITSYLWKLTPDASIQEVEPWWVVVTNVEDESLFSGPWERLTVSLFVVAPVSEGDRAIIKSRYEV